MDDEVGIEVKKEDADYVRTIMEEPLIKAFKEIITEMPLAIEAMVAGNGGS
jgi:hypothetical protein